MCQTNRQLNDVEDALASAHSSTAMKELTMIDQHGEDFDLYEWALEFSSAAGFACERVDLIADQ